MIEASSSGGEWERFESPDFQCLGTVFGEGVGACEGPDLRGVPAREEPLREIFPLEVGGSMIAVDTLVHMHRTLHRFRNCITRMGGGCYRRGGCAQIIETEIKLHESPVPQA
jgi:hypothetical protein